MLLADGQRQAYMYVFLNPNEWHTWQHVFIQIVFAECLK